MTTTHRTAPRISLRVGFTLVELLVVIVIIAVLAAVLFPVFAQARDKARSDSCAANCRQIGLSYTMYMQDWDGKLPLTKHSGTLAGWINACQPYIKNRGVYRCPSDSSANWDRSAAQDTPNTRKSSYYLNAWIQGTNQYGDDSAIEKPASVIYLAQSPNGATGDHFHPMCWGHEETYTPSCKGATFAWDSAKNETKEIATRRHQEGSSYIYMDGHAKWHK